jgi:AcrR family transcriptional regulator
VIDPLRADARRNRDRVLAAASRAFAEHGLAVPLDDIAAAAGVGPGTVYRHFPTKEALFEAVSLANVLDLAAEAPSRISRTRSPEPGPAAAVVEAVSEMQDALAVLPARAQHAGAVRGDVSAGDLVALLKGLLQAIRADPDPQLRHRLLAVVRDGLRPKVG